MNKAVSPIDPSTKIAIKSAIKEINAYTFPPGAELDQMIQRRFFPQKENLKEAPPYSTDDEESVKVRNRLKAVYGHPIVVGRTRMPGRTFFARYESDPSTATEVVAPTEALAICRLALLLMKRD